MRQTLYSKFITAYIFLGILGTVLISTLGSSLIQKHILEDTGAALYKEAISLASYQANTDYSDNADVEAAYNQLKTLSAFQDSRILILADGMGSGIRANILATLTSKIIATMMYNDMTIDEVVATIAKTLPLSSINGVAYSTFSIIQVYHTGEIYVAEYDNPECILIRQGKLKALPFSYRKIEGKKIRECRFQTVPGDALAIMSDGCLYCGTGDIMNYRWDWNALANCCETCADKTRTAAQMADMMNKACADLYGGMCSDDTTIAVARIMEEEIVNILTGPPQNKADDARMVQDFMKQEGIKIVSGGITSQIVARELGTRLITSVGVLDPEIPPTAKIEGIDLVTEGVLTLNKAIDLLEQYQQDEVSEEFFEELSRDNGATRLACYLMENCTTVNLFIGKAINKDYTTKELPFEISVRQKPDENGCRQC